MRARSLAILLAVLVACGGSRGAAVGNQPGADDASDPTTTIEQLAAASTASDGRALAAVAHPAHGLTLWFAPGAGYAIFAHAPPGSTKSPRELAAGAEDPSGYWQEHYWEHVRRAIADGLTKLDRDPADPYADVYGTCADEVDPSTFRAYLVSGRDDRLLHEADLAGDGTADEATLLRDLTVFHAWGFSAYLARHEGGWRVVHVVVTDPCSA